MGSLGVMRQFVGHMASGTLRDLLLAVAPPALASAAAELDAAELAMMDADDEATQMRYAQALAEWAEVGGYDLEVVWDVVAVAALGVPFDQAQYRELATLSGGEQKRIVLEALFRGPDEVLLLDEPDNYLDVPGKQWLEAAPAGDPQDGAADQPRPRAAGQRRRRDRHDRARRGGQHGVDASGRLHDLPRGARRAVRPSRRAAPDAGTRSTPSSRRSCSTTRPRPRTTTAWPRG